MGRKRKLPEDYAKEHDQEFEVRVVWREQESLLPGKPSCKVAENALICKFCDTFVKPKGSRISEHLISARHNEMKKRALGQFETSKLHLLSTQISQHNQASQSPYDGDSVLKFVRTIATIGITRSASIAELLKYCKELSFHGFCGVDEPKKLLDSTIETVFAFYVEKELIPMLMNHKLNLLLDVKAEINGIPGIATYVKYYDSQQHFYPQFLLDISPLPVYSIDIITTYLVNIINKYKLSWSNITTISVSGLQDFVVLKQKIQQISDAIVFPTPATEINDICIMTLSKSLPDVYAFVFLFPATVSSCTELTRRYIQQRVSKDGIQATNPILPPQIKLGDLKSWVSTAESILENWNFISRFCIENLSLPEFSMINRFLIDMEKLHRDLEGCIKLLSSLSIVTRTMDYGYISDKVNDMMTVALTELCMLEPINVKPPQHPLTSIIRSPFISTPSTISPGQSSSSGLICPSPTIHTLPLSDIISSQAANTGKSSSVGFAPPGHSTPFSCAAPYNSTNSPPLTPKPNVKPPRNLSESISSGISFTSPLLSTSIASKPVLGYHSSNSIKPTYDIIRFSIAIRESIAQIRARNQSCGIFGPGSFFEQLGLLRPNHVIDSSQDLGMFEKVLKSFTEDDWPTVKDQISEEIKTYMNFVRSGSKLDIDSRQYWNVIKTALPSLANVALNTLAVFTGNDNRFTGRIIRDYVQGSDVNLGFDNLIKMCMLNYNLT